MSNIKRQIEWATVQVEKDGKVREIDRGHIDVKARYQRIDNGNLYLRATGSSSSEAQKKSPHRWG